MGNTNATITTQIPVNEDFDYSAFAEYRDNLIPQGIFTLDNMDNMRLPGNASIFEFLLYMGKTLDEWLESISYPAEKPLYAPAYPDIIYSTETDGIVSTDSPHQKIPPIVSYEVRKRRPASMTGGKPFGKGTNWKFRTIGDFADEDGSVYRARTRFWENTIEFTCLGRSGLEAENLCYVFEKFMDLNESKFLEAGILKIYPRGRFTEEDVKLSKSGLHYRKTYFDIRTQEFQITNPLTTISGIEIDANS